MTAPRSLILTSPSLGIPPLSFPLLAVCNLGSVDCECGSYHASCCARRRQRRGRRPGQRRPDRSRCRHCRATRCGGWLELEPARQLGTRLASLLLRSVCPRERVCEVLDILGAIWVSITMSGLHMLNAATLLRTKLCCQTSGRLGKQLLSSQLARQQVS